MSPTFDRGSNPRRAPEDPNDFVFSRNSVRFSGLLRSSPEEIPGYSDYKDCPFLALDLLSFRVVFGATKYEAVDDFLAREYGEDYSLRFQIVEKSE